MIKTILEYYAIISLITLPLNIFLFVFLNKKTPLIENFNQWLDRKLGVPPPKPAEPEPKPQDKKEEDKGKKEEVIKRPENFHTALFKIPVGDVYHCMTSSVDNDSRRYTLEWTTDNDFIGTIDKDGLFTARKTGKVSLFYKRKEDISDKGHNAYQIEVVPTHREWFGNEFLSALEERTLKENVISKLMNRSILSEKPQQKSITYAGTGDYSELAVQFNMYSELERVLYVLQRHANTDDIVKELDERFEEAKLVGTGIRVWTRRYKNDKDEEIDEVTLYAFLRETLSGQRYLGISQSWREYADINEFLENIKMAEKTFSEIMPDIPVADVSAVVEKKEPPKPAPALPPVPSTPSQPSIPTQTQEPSGKPSKAEVPESKNQSSEETVVPVFVPDDMPDPDPEDVREEDRQEAEGDGTQESGTTNSETRTDTKETEEPTEQPGDSGNGSGEGGEGEDEHRDVDLQEEDDEYKSYDNYSD